MTPGLAVGNFRRIASRGFGDGANSYPHSMVWFDGRLYVGTSRFSLVVHRLTAGFVMPPLLCWPVSLPESMDLWDVDLRSQVWRWDPATDTWSAVWTAPWREGRDGRQVPLSMALRAMAVFQGRSDPAPALYLPTFPPSLVGEGAVMLRSADGVAFEVVSEPGVALLEWGFRSFRTLVPFKGRLFTAPTMGSVRGKPNIAGVAAVLCSADPARGDWEVANDPGFGDPNNLTVFELAEFAGHLYAGTANIAEGFQLWKTDGEGKPPFRWTPVLTHGAWRGKLNQGVVAMAVFGAHLYVSGAIQNGGFDRRNLVGPAAAELIRVRPDDTFDLVVADPRETPAGLKMPLSGMRAGFGNPLAGYFWKLCEHEGWLYCGTFDASPILPFHSLSTAPEFVRTLLSGPGLEHFMRTFGGFDLWRTADGVAWLPGRQNGRILSPHVTIAPACGISPSARASSRNLFIPASAAGVMVYFMCRVR